MVMRNGSIYDYHFKAMSVQGETPEYTVQINKYEKLSNKETNKITNVNINYKIKFIDKRKFM